MRIGIRTVGALALLCWLAPLEASAQTATPLSSGTLPPGQAEVSGFVGFPYITVDGGYGFTRRFDLSLIARSAWQDVQRVGLQGRIRLSDPMATHGFALRLGFDTWTGRPKPHPDGSNPWIDITGLQDFTGSLDGIFSWSTSRGTVLTALAGVDLVMDRQPQVLPLSPAPALAFGPNLALRIAAEVPYENGFLFAFDLGLDIHLSGFDTVAAMPEFSVGIGHVL